MSSPTPSARVVPQPSPRSRSSSSQSTTAHHAANTGAIPPDLPADKDVGQADDSSASDDNAEGDLPMSMTASVMLTHLPKDASQALKEIEAIDDRKGM
jgi:ubiquitin-like protein ATG12